MQHTIGQEGGRDAVLGELMELGCDVMDADAFAAFVSMRAEILQRLDAIKDPWTQAQKTSLQEALEHGASMLAAAQQHRQDLAKKIDQLRGAKRAHKGYQNAIAPRIKKQF